MTDDGKKKKKFFICRFFVTTNTMTCWSGKNCWCHPESINFYIFAMTNKSLIEMSHMLFKFSFKNLRKWNYFAQINFKIIKPNSIGHIKIPNMNIICQIISKHPNLCAQTHFKKRIYVYSSAAISILYYIGCCFFVICRTFIKWKNMKICPNLKIRVLNLFFILFFYLIVWEEKYT